MDLSVEMEWSVKPSVSFHSSQNLSSKLGCISSVSPRTEVAELPHPMRWMSGSG